MTGDDRNNDGTGLIPVIHNHLTLHINDTMTRVTGDPGTFLALGKKDHVRRTPGRANLQRSEIPDVKASRIPQYELIPRGDHEIVT